MKEMTTIAITNEQYKIDDQYFRELMINLGMFIANRYENGKSFTACDLMSEVAYVGDLSIQQKMYVAFWLGLHFKGDEYANWILKFMNTFQD